MRESAASAHRSLLRLGLSGFVAGRRSPTYLHGAAVRQQALGIGEGGDHRTKGAQSAGGNLLHARAAYEIRGGKPATSTCASARWKHVIGAAGVVANGLRAPGAEKHAPGGGQFVREVFLLT